MYPHLKLFDVSVLVMLELIVDGSPAHRLLDDLVVIRDVGSIDEIQEKLLPVHPTWSALQVMEEKKGPHAEIFSSDKRSRPSCGNKNESTTSFITWA